jgi:hypothetical protein
MQTASGAFATAIEGNDVTVDYRVTVTPVGISIPYTDYSAAVESINIDEQLTTDMPDGTRSITGYPSRSATVQLAYGTVVDPADNAKTLGWLLNPQSVTSPLYRGNIWGALITIDLGVQLQGAATPEFVRKFTGTVDDYTVDAQAGTISLTCLDYRSKLRNVPQLPSFVGAPESNWNGTPGLTAVYPVDYLLRTNGIHTVPAPHTGCVLFASMQGSAWPQISGPEVFANDDQDTPGTGLTTTGHFGQQVPPYPFVQADVLSPLDIGSAGGWFFQCWVRMDAGWQVEVDLDSDASLSSFSALVFTAATADLNTGRLAGPVNKTVTMPANSTGWHLLAAQVTLTGSTTATVKVWVDSTSATTNITGLAAADTGANAQANVAVVKANVRGPLEAIQISSELAAVPDTAFVPTAVLDASLNTLTAMPAVTSKDSWGVMQQIARAEAGVAGFDETGIFRTKNRNTIKNQAVARTVNAMTSLKSLAQQVSGATFANRVQVPVSALQVSAPTWVWAAPDIIAVPAGGTVTRFVTTDNPVVDVPLHDSGVCPAGTSPDGNTYYRASNAPDGNGLNITYGVAITTVQLSPTTLKVSITNSRGGTIYLCTPLGAGFPVSPSGETAPFLLIGGKFVTPVVTAGDDSTSGGQILADAQYPPESEGGAASSAIGEVSVAFSVNEWQQDVDQAQALAEDTLIDLSVLRPLYRNVSIVADPRVQLADRVTVLDPDTSGVNADAMLIGSHISVGPADWNQTVDLRALDSPGTWLTDVAGRSEVGDTSADSTLWIV